MNNTFEKAQWIWHPQDDYVAYHRTILASRTFQIKAHPENATVAITADSWYRLYVNGIWVNDGPARSWPEHYSYDLLTITPYLKKGENKIEVIACFFGCGSYHQYCRQAGLLMHADISLAHNSSLSIVTDGDWDTSALHAWLPNTPKISQQMEPQEYYDARLESLSFTKAAVLFPAHDAPWKDLTPRDSALLSRVPVNFNRFLHAVCVEKDWCCWTFPIARLLYPGVIEMNASVTMPVCLSIIITSPDERILEIESYWPCMSINGEIIHDRKAQLKKGENIFVGGTCMEGPGKDQSIRFINHKGLSFSNPIDREHENPWAFADFEQYLYQGDDLNYNTWFPTPEWSELMQNIAQAYHSTCTAVKDIESFNKVLKPRAKCLPSDVMCVHDPILQFEGRRVCTNATPHVDAPDALIFDNTDITTIHPHDKCDIELCYDLGVQNIGYYELDLTAPEGTIIDIAGVEYIANNGHIQHTLGSKNCLRYVCTEGVNRFLSVKRRSGRYIFITLRNLSGPVHIRHIRLIESTYPINAIAQFNCSNDAFVRIWEISARALKLCMEDTFTDCPLYEQTLWIGDARNEALFAETAFGAHDLIRRCLRLGGQSLEHYPLVGAQVPSAWDMLLPAWSFLWGIGVWDYYFATKDTQFLKEIWHDVMTNVRNAADMRDERGLFSGPFWNMFDWAAVDDRHLVVFHNSLFLVGALQAAHKCARVLEDKDAAQWIETTIAELTDAINVYWNPETKTYPDSIHDNGETSPKTCQHTSFLALLYDVIPQEYIDAAMKNCSDPPDTMTHVGSPFAIQYLYEALEHSGREDMILESIMKNFVPMLHDGATTVWESFPTSVLSYQDFPTRSHCHAWSATPLYFLNRIVLGIRPIEPGGTAYEISPFLDGMEWANGASAGANGPVYVRWEKTDDALYIAAGAAENISLTYKANRTHEGLTVTFEQLPIAHFLR